METDERILMVAKDLFWKYGIKSITMDDISKELGMSKKTIYQYFTDKDAVVLEITRREFSAKQVECDRMCSEAKNAVHEILLTMKQMGEMFGNMNAKLFYDLQKYHTEAWNYFSDFKESYLLTIIENNLKRGITEGLYRPSLNIKIMARIRAYQVELAFNPVLFPPDKFNLVDVQMQMIDHFLHGIATIKGHRMINKYQEETDEE
ncbi:MAG: TetR/AcrR family transcriptional regulator [Bacteroidota bacterium]